MGVASKDPFIPYTGSIDPRIDWTIGRRGIPYLDWGLHPGQDWIRDQVNGGPYSAIKNVYYKKQEGSLTDKSFWTSGVTANNYVFIRYPHLLLWAAECEVDADNLEQARTYVNMVRARAANAANWVKTYINNDDPAQGFTNTPAANYKVGLYTSIWTNAATALAATRFEERLEFAMEGHRFFDLVRWGIAAQVMNDYIAKEKSQRTYLNDALFETGKSEYFPIPQEQIDLSYTNGKATLTQNPGY